MARRILKYRLRPEERVYLPRHAKVVHVAEQDNCPTVWVETREEQSDQRRYSSLYIIGTGWILADDDAEHVGTAAVGMHIWHVYQTSEVPE